MAVKDINAKSWALPPSADGRRHSAYPSGNAPSGGTSSLSWVAPEGIAVGKRLMLMSDGTHNLVIPDGHRFTGFSQSSATAGDTVVINDTDFDALPSASIERPKYSSVARGQGRSIDVFQSNGSLYELRACGNQLPTGTSEVFVSYALRIPSTSYLPFLLPEQDPGGPGLWPMGSTAKWVWLLDYDGGSTKTDIVVPTTVDKGGLLSGNGLTYPPLRNLGPMSGFFRFDQWNRMSTWIKCGADPDVDTGSMWFDCVNEVDTAFQLSANGVIFTDEPAPHEWGRIHWGGWSRSRASKDCEVLLTDMYIAYGSNASARLEIGNAATYSACTDRAICVPVKSHSSKAIEYSIERGGIDLGGDSWLYYVDGSNTPTLVGKFT